MDVRRSYTCKCVHARRSMCARCVRACVCSCEHASVCMCCLRVLDRECMLTLVVLMGICPVCVCVRVRACVRARERVRVHVHMLACRVVRNCCYPGAYEALVSVLTHSHARTCTRARAHTHTHNSIRPHARPHARTRTRSLFLSFSRAHIPTHCLLHQQYALCSFSDITLSVLKGLQVQK